MSVIKYFYVKYNDIFKLYFMSKKYLQNLELCLTLIIEYLETTINYIYAYDNHILNLKLI